MYVDSQWKLPQLDSPCPPGYSSLHLAACWGHLETVKTLVELGADIQAVTFKGERPVDLARKYSRTDCADCLSLAGEMLRVGLKIISKTFTILKLFVCLCAAAEQDFTAYVAFVKQLITDPERHLTREEKVTHFFTSGFKWMLTLKMIFFISLIRT